MCCPGLFLEYGNPLQIDRTASGGGKIFKSDSVDNRYPLTSETE